MKSLYTVASLGALVFALFAPGCTSTDEGPEERSAEFYNHNAQSYYEGKDFARANQQFQKALDIDADDSTALLGRAWSVLMLSEGQILLGAQEGGNSVQLAEEYFNELEEENFGDNQYKVELGMGKVHVLLGDLYGRRANLLEQRKVYRPDAGAPTGTFAEAEAARDQEYTQAATYFSKVLAMSDEPGAADNLTALIQLARIAVYRRDYGGGLLYAERYLEQVRRSKDNWVASLRKYPDDKEIWERKLAGAVRKEVEVRDLIANAYFKLEQFGHCEDELKRIILLDPDRGDAYLNIGIVREHLGRDTAALADYAQFMTMAARIGLPPEDPGVQEATKRIRKLEQKLGLEPSFRVSVTDLEVEEP